MKIKNILFDLGKVLLPLSIERKYDAFDELQKLSGTHPQQKKFRDLYNLSSQHPQHDLFECGLISAESFYDFLRSDLSLQCSDKELEQAWCASLNSLPENRLKMLSKLREGYHLYLLSNTNSVHLDWINKYAISNREKKALNVNEIGDFFDRAFYSHIAGLRKPNREIYHYVCDNAEIDPLETLFIDDNQANATAGKEFGFITHHLVEDEVEEILPKYLIDKYLIEKSLL